MTLSSYVRLAVLMDKLGLVPETEKLKAMSVEPKEENSEHIRFKASDSMHRFVKGQAERYGTSMSAYLSACPRSLWRQGGAGMRLSWSTPKS